MTKSANERDHHIHCWCLVQIGTKRQGTFSVYSILWMYQSIKLVLQLAELKLPMMFAVVLWIHPSELAMCFRLTFAVTLNLYIVPLVKLVIGVQPLSHFLVNQVFDLGKNTTKEKLHYYFFLLQVIQVLSSLMEMQLFEHETILVYSTVA